MRNAIVLVRGTPGDVVPSAPPDLTGVAFLLGYEPGHGSDVIEDYRRTTRRARVVVERLFYESE
jgi:glutamate-ammonia-ligase adenylyltransferase